VLGTHGADHDENRVGFKAPELAAPPTGVRLADQRRKLKAQPDRWQLKRTHGNPGDDTCTHARDSVQGLKAGQEIGAGLRNGEKTSSRTGSGREKKEQIVRTTEETGDATDVGTTLPERNQDQMRVRKSLSAQAKKIGERRHKTREITSHENSPSYSSGGQILTCCCANQ
jgi:hypothetical protein